jgi:formylglycine-generating enzyme required for sulfatase activity
MKRLNKYHWLIIISAIVFSVFYIRSCKEDSKVTGKNTHEYPLKLIDNEIRLGEEVLYRFIPVDGGKMDFSYKYTDYYNDKKDSSDVYISKQEEIRSFLIGETPVDNRFFAYIMDDKKEVYKTITPYLYEVETKKVWMIFIEKLQKETGHVFGIPSNYEWEYAARGGQLSKNYVYSGSNDINEVAKYLGNTHKDTKWELGKEKKANELGLYDMSGSVWELTSTMKPEIFTFLNNVKTTNNPQYLEEEKTTNIARGGDYKSDAVLCRTRFLTLSNIKETGLRLILIR